MQRGGRSVRNCFYLYPYATLTETQGRPSKLGRPVETGRGNARSKDEESNVKPSDYLPAGRRPRERVLRLPGS